MKAGTGQRGERPGPTNTARQSGREAWLAIKSKSLSRCWTQGDGVDHHIQVSTGKVVKGHLLNCAVGTRHFRQGAFLPTAALHPRPCCTSL